MINSLFAMFDPEGSARSIFIVPMVVESFGGTVVVGGLEEA
jgi:hypothetical protein